MSKKKDKDKKHPISFIKDIDRYNVEDILAFYYDRDSEIIEKRKAKEQKDKENNCDPKDDDNKLYITIKEK